MPTLKHESRLRKIGLERIRTGENIRRNYEDIDDLAQSIKLYGLLSPVLVKESAVEGEYDLVAGFRRIHALRRLVEEGNDFREVDTIVVKGDSLVLRIIENIQRSDLTFEEREEAIWQLHESGGHSSEETAALLGKSARYVKMALDGRTARRRATALDMSLPEISTEALAMLDAAIKDDEEYAAALEMLREAGGQSAAPGMW